MGFSDFNLSSQRRGTGALDPSLASNLRKTGPLTLQTGQTPTSTTPELQTPEFSVSNPGSLNIETYHSSGQASTHFSFDDPSFQTPPSFNSSLTGDLSLSALRNRTAPNINRVTQVVFPSLSQSRPGISLEAIRQSQRDQNQLETQIKKVAPDLAPLLSGVADHKYAMSEGLNYPVTQLLLSADPQVQNRFQAAYDRMMANPGSQPSSEELELLESFNYSIKDGKLFDNQENRLVETGERAPVKELLANRRFEGISQALRALEENGGQPSQSAQALLKTVGLQVDKNGMLYNLANPNRTSSLVPPEQQRQLGNLINYLSRGISNDEEPVGVNLKALNLAANPLHALNEGSITSQALQERLASVSGSLVANLKKEAGLQQDLSNNLRMLTEDKQSLDLQNQENAETLTQIESLTEQISTMEQENLDTGAVGIWLRSVPANITLEEAVNNADPAMREKINRLFEKHNISLIPDRYGNPALAQRPDAFSTLDFGMSKRIDRAALGRILGTESFNQNVRIEDAKRQAAQLQQKYQTGIANAERLTAKLDEGLEQQGRLVTSLGQVTAMVTSDQAQLVELRNDPNWSSLPESVRNQTDALINQAQQSIQRTNNLIHQAQDLTEQVAASQNRFRRDKERGQAVLEQLNNALAALEKQQKKLLDALKGQQLPTAAVSDQLDQQLAQLNAELNLVPRPFFIGVDRLREQWEAILKDTSKGLDSHFNSQQQLTDMDHRREAEHLQKIKQGLDYHMTKIEEGNKLSQGQLKAWLEASIAEIRTQIADLAQH